MIIDAKDGSFAAGEAYGPLADLGTIGPARAAGVGEDRLRWIPVARLVAEMERGEAETAMGESRCAFDIRASSV